MENKDYTATLTVSQPADVVFKNINSVSKWWTENLAGNSENPDDSFTADFGGDNFVTHKLIEVIPNKRVV